MGIDTGILSAIKNHKEKIEGPHFLFSAENPRHPEKNQLGLDHEQTLHHLKGAGYDAHEVKGSYGSPERSIVVYNVKPEHATQLHSLASKLGQDSSIYSTGKAHEMLYHHGEQKGKKVKGEGTTWHDQKPKDFYTSLPGEQHHFTHNFNFEKSENKMGLVHYSRKGDLKSIDPKFKGSAAANTQDKNAGHKYSFYYKENSEPEQVVTEHATHKYKTSVDTSRQPLYDIGEDKNKYVQAAKEKNNGALNMDDVHDKIKGAGFHGFHNSKHPSLSHVVAMYHPLKVEHSEKLR